ncbi:MAG: NIPSNAP family protein [Bryobacteraceae bacterium]|nr:NIPSNAP family protein [Bryobacterales bacterium]MEB2361152.1 NIPSNAP family protein [Bryobacterales bacterium]NUN01898.1 NIPSNAP family protein [Bryobacteraceae bacterium]
MYRRAFMYKMGGLGLIPASTSFSQAPMGRGARFYVLDNYYLRNGSQVARMHDFLRSVAPVLKEIHAGPAIFLEALVAPHMPQIATIAGFQSLQEWETARRKGSRHEAFLKALRTLESGEEAPYEHFSETLLEATDYSPEIAVPESPPATQRIFELRVYHSPTFRQLRALHERFAGPEIRIFNRVGVHPILYTSGLTGQNLPNLTYLIPFENLAAREKAWQAFSADPEWVKVRRESIERSGQISSVMNISLYKAADYSPIR